ncbi:MAG: peptide ABC transporter permease, partial [Chloroflexi bacterium]|nr:peptide ABC transporter permease [Chloroflexota bacterium]
MSATVAAPPLVTAAPSKALRPQSTLWGDAIWRYSRNRLAVGALVVVALFIAMAVLADIISPARYDFSALAEANQFPSA